MHSNKCLFDRFTSLVVQSESEARPVESNSVPLELVNNFVSVFVFPVPNFLDEFLSAQVVSSLLVVLPKLVFYNILA